MNQKVKGVAVRCQLNSSLKLHQRCSHRKLQTRGLDLLERAQADSGNEIQTSCQKRGTPKKPALS